MRKPEKLNKPEKPEKRVGTTPKREYSMEVRETASNLYIYRQKTYEEISKITGVSVPQLQRWGVQEDWRGQKLGQVKKRVDYRKDLYLLRDTLLENAKTSTDPQRIHALAALQRIIDSEEKMKPVEDLPVDPERKIGLSEETLAKIKEEIYGLQTK